MGNRQTFDVMIVGAGPAGISTWLHLRQYAPSLADHTVLIDKAVFPRPKLCGGGLWPWSETCLNRLEIEFDFPVLHLSDVVFRFRDRRWVFHSPRPFRMVSRTAFDMALVTSARKRGLQFMDNERFVAAHCEKDFLRVRTNRGSYRVKALVGADGSLSKVRRVMLGGHHPPCLGVAVQVCAPVDPHLDPEFDRKELVIDFTPVADGLQGYVWHFPCLRDGKPCMKHGIGDFRCLDDRPKANLEAIFSRALHARHLDDTPAAWSSHPVRWFSKRVPVARPHVLLVGDAAGIDCALGGGIYMALSYGHIAARVLGQAFEEGDFSFGHYRQVLVTDALGKDLTDFNRLAHTIYSGHKNPLDEVRDFFTDRLIQSKLSSLLRGRYEVPTT